MFGMVVFDILLKRRRRLVLSTLCLNRNDLGTELKYKVYLAVFIGVVTGLDIKLAAQLLQEGTLFLQECCQ